MTRLVGHITNFVDGSQDGLVSHMTRLVRHMIVPSLAVDIHSIYDI